MAKFFTLNTGAKIPSVGLGTWQSEPGLVGAAVIAAVKNDFSHRSDVRHSDGTHAPLLGSRRPTVSSWPLPSAVGVRAPFPAFIVGSSDPCSAPQGRMRSVLDSSRPRAFLRPLFSAMETRVSRSF
ncbi:hypothetical protein MUK42_03454 [Musa troglodytarum]|uniref:Uncharacterized protein n=1 Tax=Musa troglodytarum TaxID=320322 RepID=A0A9E7K619_9LILI|nr:hypothetical protein MUK42_03454 [Musa troglodytarum]